MKYTDVQGTERTLTQFQRSYLVDLNRKGHLELHAGRAQKYDSRVTMRLLVERGLATGMDWHCPLSPHCLTGVTELGKTVVQEANK